MGNWSANNYRCLLMAASASGVCPAAGPSNLRVGSRTAQNCGSARICNYSGCHRVEDSDPEKTRWRCNVNWKKKKRGRVRCAASMMSEEEEEGEGQGGVLMKAALQRLGLTGPPAFVTQLDVKKAYRKLALQFHPDVCKDGLSSTTFMEINDAYQTIMDCLHGETTTLDVEPFVPEGMMGSNDETWEDWEEWMGWEGASGSRDYTTHINLSI